MTDKNPDWQWYRSFLAVVRAGSLSGAARALGTTQPTVGRQLSALEESLGVTLFARSQEGLAPTEAGLQLIPAAEAMAAAAQSARRSVSAAGGAERGVVRITASEVIGVEVLPSMLARFRNDHPDIDLELAVSNENADLLRGDADVAVRMVRPTQSALIAKRIGRIDIGLHAHRGYLKAHGVPRSLADLAQHALIGFDRDAAYVRLLARTGIMIDGVAIDRSSFAFKSDSDLAQLAALRAGLGIGVSQIGIARRDKNLIPLLHDQLTFPLDLWLAMHRDHRSSRRIRLLFDHLARELLAYVRQAG